MVEPYVWSDLFPTREEYEASGGGFATPPAGENPPPAGTRMGIIERDGKYYYMISSGQAGIMPRLEEVDWPFPWPRPEEDVYGENGGDGGDGGDGGEPEPWETPYEAPYPSLTLPRYQAFGAEYPVSDLPVYEPFPSPYPTLELPLYQPFPVEYPKLGPMYEQAEDVISRMLTGEGLGLPVEELMAAYTEEERLAMKEYIPKLREYWGAKGLLRSGMEREAEREVTQKAASARGTYRAQLEKESVIRQQDGIVTGLQLSMQHLNLGYGAQTDAWQAMNREYTKVYESEIMVGTAHFEASTRAWDAAMTEYTKVFSSEVAKTEFGQRIQEMAFGVARDEYQRVYQSAFQGGLSEFDAQARGWDAAWREFDTFRRLLFDWGRMEAEFGFRFEFLELEHEFDKIMFGLRAELELELKRMGIDAQRRQSIWDAILKGIGKILFGSLW